MHLRSRHLRNLVFSLFLAGLMSSLVPRQAWCFAVEAHRMLTERALRGIVKSEAIASPNEKSVADFWSWLGAALAADGPTDGNDPQRFRDRYAAPRSFDAWSARGFLGMNQELNRQVWGVEAFDKGPAIERFGVVIDAVGQPDLDRRNQERFAFDEKRKPLMLNDGRRVPADPMALNMGAPTGLSSQAHAHYQLGADRPSDAVATLQAEPWNFVVAAGFPTPRVETYAADMAQIHLDMAILARQWGLQQANPTGEYLSLVWLGAGMHYVEDVAGPLHTVQVGSYELFKRAKVQYWLLALKTGGGVLGSLPSFTSIGLGFLHNYHMFAEAWLLLELEKVQGGKPAQAAVAQAWAKAGEDDPELLKALGDRLQAHLTGPTGSQPWQEGRGAGSILVETLAKHGARDGAAMYDAAARAASSRLSQPGVELEDDAGLPAWAMGARDDADVLAAEQQMAELHGRSVRRATTAARLYWQAFQQGSPAAAARRLRRTRLDQLQAQEQRQKAWLAHPTSPTAPSEREPGWLYGEIAAALLLLTTGGVLIRRRKRKVVHG